VIYRLPDALHTLLRISALFALGAIFYIVIWWQTTLYGLSRLGDAIVLLTLFYCFRADHLWNFKHIANKFNWILTLSLTFAFGAALLLTRSSVNTFREEGLLFTLLWVVFRAIWEETIFRGILFAKFVDNQPPARVVWILLLSALFFTLSHAGNYLASSVSDTYILYVLLWG
jgi:membrane protease YdiL (CAAX protease family)